MNHGLIDVATSPNFLIERDTATAFFERRGRTLFVTFDNLATVGEYDPPQPWNYARTKAMDVSVLGIIAKRKDWYRHEDAPNLISELKAKGFFDAFERVIFTGASMGAFAALVFAPLVPEATVLAFSPQTTLNTDIVPFETRFRYGRRKWDWEDPAFRDTVDRLDEIKEAWLIYDPFIMEDRAHATRMLGAHVHHLKCGFFGHGLIRQVKACGALDDLFQGFADGRFDEGAFRRQLRNRRKVRAWGKALVTNVERAGHRKLAEVAARKLLTIDPKAPYLSRALARFEAPMSTTVTFPMAEAAQAPFEGAVDVVRHGYVMPDRAHDARFASGVLLADRSYCERSRTWIRARKTTVPPTLKRSEVVEDLAGRHLFAGHIRGHFGHFLVESTARLWALGALEEPVDGIIFTPYRGKPRAARIALKSLRPFFDQLGITVPIQSFPHAVRVEELIVPELGFGWNERYAGSPQYRAYMRSRLGASIVAEGAERLYISRARLPDVRGRVLGEEVIERMLADQGYEVFHPEKHPLEVQIARYKAAKQIVALDGSALHLAAFFMGPEDRVAIIQRRSRSNVVDYIRQYQAFCGIKLDVIDVITRDWVSGDAKRSDYKSVGEVDFAALAQALVTLGCIDPPNAAFLPSEADVMAMVDALSEARGEPFRPLTD